MRREDGGLRDVRSGVCLLHADCTVFQPAGKNAGGAGIVVGADGAAVDFQFIAPGFFGAQPALPFGAMPGVADTMIGQLKGTAGIDEPTDAVGWDLGAAAGVAGAA
jgi:hypothetical protein